MQETSTRSRVPSITSRCAGVALLLLPIIVAVWVALAGRRYDPAVYGFETESARLGPAGGLGRSAEATQSAKEDAPAPGSVPRHLIPEAFLPPVDETAFYQPEGDPEHFDEITIYDKIDGAAPEYLDLGFRELMTQSYAARNPDFFGCEVFIYDMGSPAAAAQIYKQQRGEGVEDVVVGGGGYRFGAAWYFHRGPYYVIVLNSDAGQEAERFSEMIARRLEKRMNEQRTIENGQ